MKIGHRASCPESEWRSFGRLLVWATRHNLDRQEDSAKPEARPAPDQGACAARRA
jgi:hypothetical protein